MKSNLKNSEAELLEQFRVALTNVESQPEIARIMTELGYDSEKIAEGKELLQFTTQAYQLNKTEDDETSEAYNTFSKKKELLEEEFNRHRKKAKVIFRKDPITSERLAIAGAKPRSYVKFLETVKKFYTEALKDESIQTKLARLAITQSDLSATAELIMEMEAARTDYYREKGESQDATKRKDTAFAEMEDWMSEFYAIAKIGLEDNPQLLESLAKFVRS